MTTVGEWLTVDEAANWIGLPREVIEMAATNKEIPALALGGLIRINRDALLNLLGMPPMAPAPTPNQPVRPVGQVIEPPAPPAIRTEPVPIREPLSIPRPIQPEEPPVRNPEPPARNPEPPSRTGFVSRFGGRH